MGATRETCPTYHACARISRYYLPNTLAHSHPRRRTGHAHRRPHPRDVHREQQAPRRHRRRTQHHAHRAGQVARPQRGPHRPRQAGDGDADHDALAPRRGRRADGPDERLFVNHQRRAKAQECVPTPAPHRQTSASRAFCAARHRTRWLNRAERRMPPPARIGFSHFTACPFPRCLSSFLLSAKLRSPSVLRITKPECRLFT